MGGLGMLPQHRDMFKALQSLENLGVMKGSAVRG